MGLGQYSKGEASSSKDSHGIEGRLDWFDQLPLQSNYTALNQFLEEFEITTPDDFLDFVRKFDKILHGARLKEEADARSAAVVKQLKEELLEHRIRANIRRRVREISESGETPRGTDQADPMAAVTAQAIHDEMKHRIRLHRPRRMRESGESKKEANSKAAAIDDVELDEDDILWMKYVAKHASKNPVANNEPAASEHQIKVDARMMNPPEAPHREEGNGRRSRYWKEMEAAAQRAKASNEVHPTEKNTDIRTKATRQKKNEAKPDTEQEAKDRERQEAGVLTDKQIMDALPADFRRRLETWQRFVVNRKDFLRPSLVAVRALKANLQAKRLAERTSRNPTKAGMEQRDFSKEHQVSRAQLWHWRAEHLNYHHLRKILTPIGQLLFEVDDFDISDVPVCQHCTAMGRNDRASILDPTCI